MLIAGINRSTRWFCLLSNIVIDRLSATLALDEPVSRVRLVSPARAKALAGLGISTIRDLITHYPRRYIDLSHKLSVANASIGATCTIEGVVHEVKLKRPKPRLALVEITLVDDTGTLMVTCFRQPWLAEQIKSGMRIAVAGKVEFNYGFKRMTNPYIEKLEGNEVAEGMIIPVHPACEKISPAWMRRLVDSALQHTCGMLDPLPLELRMRYKLMSRQNALACIHFPRSMDEVAQARRRLIYEEVLLLQLMMLSEGAKRSAGIAPCVHDIDGDIVRLLPEKLPFELTDEQVSAKNEILAHMAEPKAMNHMLLGDVGTGKTAVAAFALAACAESGGQAVLMAPTEVLAVQHSEKLGQIFDQLGVSWALLSGSTTPKEREAILKKLSSGDITLLFGTHAVLEDDVHFARLMLAVIDEQQRFGVDQRAALLAKGQAPDALYLTATPIPRTLALALYGDLTLSYIKHRPHDSAKRRTVVCHKESRGVAYEAAREALERGEQVYVVCPLIGQDTQARDEKAQTRKREVDEEAYEYAAISIEDDTDLAFDNVSAATQEVAYLKHSLFPDFEVALLHGRMSSTEKQDIMERFRQNEINILVATTVIEVGVDVPNATVMIIEDADRFGLSQLHQLRGRVGRGTKPAEVYLVSASRTDTALARLRAMEKTDDGFELATYDLSLRREGDILGNRQSGASVLKLVNVVRDGAVIEAAHADACELLKFDPHFELPENQVLMREMRRMFAGEHVVSGG